MSAQQERQYLEQFLSRPEARQLLETIKFAEGTRRENPEDSYRVQFGGGLFQGDFSRHPDQVIRRNNYASSATGAYQFLTPTWQNRAERLGLQSFGPRDQDLAALSLAHMRLQQANLGGLDVLTKEGLTPRVSAALAPEWASFPTLSGRSYYGQPVKSHKVLSEFYKGIQPVAGETLTSPSTAAQPVKPDSSTQQVTPQQPTVKDDSLSRRRTALDLVLKRINQPPKEIPTVAPQINMSAVLAKALASPKLID